MAATKKRKIQESHDESVYLETIIEGECMIKRGFHILENKTQEAFVHHYKNNILDGLCQGWNLDGTIAYIMNYHNGILQLPFNQFKDGKWEFKEFDKDALKIPFNPRLPQDTLKILPLFKFGDVGSK